MSLTSMLKKEVKIFYQSIKLYFNLDGNSKFHDLRIKFKVHLKKLIAFRIIIKYPYLK